MCSLFINMQIIWQKLFLSNDCDIPHIPHSCILWEDLTLLQLRTSQTKQTIKCLLTAKFSLLPNNLLRFFSSTLRPNMPSISPDQYYFALRTYCGLMSHKLFIISRKWGVSFSTSGGKWLKKLSANVENISQALTDFFEVSKRVIWFDRQWDCCDCGRNIYTKTTQRATKTITAYYSYETLLYI